MKHVNLEEEFMKIFMDHLNNIHPVFIDDDEFDYINRLGIINVAFNRDATKSDFVEWLNKAGCLNKDVPLNIRHDKSMWTYRAEETDRAEMITKMFYLEPENGHRKQEHLFLVINKDESGAILNSKTRDVHPINIHRIIMEIGMIPVRIRFGHNRSYRLVDITGITDFLCFPDTVRKSLYNCLNNQMVEND